MTAGIGRDAERDSLLLAVLPHVAFDGWTPPAMAAGARDAGFEAADVARLFPGGAAEMVRRFSDWADGQMIARLRETDLDGLGVRARIRLAVRCRIDALGPHREAARRAASFLALPSNARLALGCLYRSVDAIWRASGDRSADFNFYTKRALLAGVYGATLVYLMEDESADFEATWAFLDRRIADVMGVQKLRGRPARLGRLWPSQLGSSGNSGTAFDWRSR